MRLKPDPVTSEESSIGGAEGEYYVLGGEHVGTSVVRRLHEDGHPVTAVGPTHDSDEVPGLRGDPSDLRALETAGVSDASTVVVAMPCDSQNLLTAQLVRAHFDAPAVVVLVNSPGRYELFAEVGHEPVCATTTLSDALVDELRESNRSVDQTT